MRKHLIPTMAVIAALTFVSCKSTVTAKDVMGQEESAKKALTKAQEELVELAEMKEQYSIDGIKAKVKKLKAEKSQIDKDIKKLQGVEHEGTASATEGIVSDLKNKSKNIESQIKELESMPKESWAKSIESINNQIQSLQEEVNRITANVDSSAE